MTPYTLAKLHIERHAYRSGWFKGDAPADPSRRRRNHERLCLRHADTHPDHHIALRFHRTDCVRVYPDGRIVLDTDGWHSSSTTRIMVNDCISRLRLPFGWMHTKRVGGISQTAIGAWKFYDGMTFDSHGMLLTGPMSWNARRADRAARKEYLSSPQWTGFAAVFPLLFDQAEATWSALYGLKGRHLRSRLTDPDQWARTAAAAKRKHVTAKDALAALRRAAVEDLTEMYEQPTI